MIRIVVGTPPGPRSELWRIFTKGDDICVQRDAMRKDLKTSLHKSGASHHKWTDGGAERWVRDGDRYMMRWDEPEEFGPGGTTFLRIVIPTDHLMLPDEEPALAKMEKISLLVDSAPAGEATFLSIAVTDSDTVLKPSKDLPSELLASWPLPTRGTVWIVATHEPWDRFQDAVTAALPQMRDQLEQGIGHTVLPGQRNNARAVLSTGTDEAGVPHMIEVGVEYGRD